jgi:hypothetical protein
LSLVPNDRILRRMIRQSLLLAVFVAAPAHVAAQSASPSAISGTPTSARHCLSGNAANVHSLGWLESGSLYTIRFDADFAVTARMVRYDAAAGVVGVSEGEPEFNFRASSSGTRALLVSSSGADGCYRYQVAVDPPAASLAPATVASERRLEDISGSRVAPAFQAQAISGFPSSASHCIAGQFVANVHEIGSVDQESTVTVSFETDFAAAAAVATTPIDPAAGAGRVAIDNDGQGAPSLSFIAPPATNLVLFVSGVNGAAGCYRYKVEIR